MTRRIRFTMMMATMALIAASCQFDFSASIGDSPKFDPERLGDEIAAGLAVQLGGDFQVDCPADQPIEANVSFECQATDEFGRVGIIAVTASDDDGAVDWELVEVLSAPGGTEDSPVDPAAGEPARPADVPDDWVRFAAPNAGYLLWHPPGWIVERAQGTEIFRGPEGTDANRTNINVQVVTTTIAGGFYPDEDALYADLYNQIVGAGGEVYWEEEDELHLPSGSRRALGLQGHWQMQGEQFMQLAVVLARDEATLVQISYTAPIELYEDSLELAITIIESFDVIF